MIRAASRDELYWLSQRLGGVPFAEDVLGIVVEVGGVTQGQVALDHWMPNSVKMAVSANSRSVRTLMRAAIEYVTRDCGREIIRAEIPSHSATAHRLAGLYGFKEVLRIPDGYAKGDALVLYERRK